MKWSISILILLHFPECLSEYQALSLLYTLGWFCVMCGGSEDHTESNTKMEALDSSAFWSVLEAAVNKWMFLPLFVHFSMYSCWWFRGGNSGHKWRKTFLAGVIKRDKWVESVKSTQLTEGGFVFTHALHKIFSTTSLIFEMLDSSCCSGVILLLKQFENFSVLTSPCFAAAAAVFMCMDKTPSACRPRNAIKNQISRQTHHSPRPAHLVRWSPL